MQLFGSFVQSMLHRNRSHDIHPIGGVLPSPLSNVDTHVINTMNNGNSFSISDKIHKYNDELKSIMQDKTTFDFD